MDLLVKLYEIETAYALINEVREEQDVIIRKGIAPEKYVVLEWIKNRFSENWSSEADVAFSQNPVSIFLATKNRDMIGFACYNATGKGFFGPTGVDKGARCRKIGSALLLASLNAMKEEGFGYAVIGGAGPVDFYKKVAGGIPIEGSEPGFYYDFLQ